MRESTHEPLPDAANAPMLPRDMKLFLWVCVGGAAGSGARYLIAVWSLERLGKAFPWGTLAVNVVGCLFLGVLMRIGEKSGPVSPTLLIALTTGVLGGFTTYSSFNFEVFRMVQQGHARTAVAYVLLTLGGGFLASALGYAGARAVRG